VDSYEPGDARLAWSVTPTEDGALSGSKWPTTIGGEDMHAIRSTRRWGGGQLI
jgi:hypothetical protein